VTVTDTPAPGSPEALEAQLKSLVDEATGLVDKADTEGRDFSAEEQARVNAIFNEAKGLRQAREKAQGRVALRDQIDGLVSPADAKALNDAVRNGTPLPPDAKARSIGRAFTENEHVKSYLGQWPNGIPESTKGIRTPPVEVGGIKALLTSGDIGPMVAPMYYGLLPPSYQRDLVVRNLVTNGTTGSDSVEFARLTSTTSNAAPVAEATDVAGTSGLKPQSDLTFEKVVSPVRTIAHWLAATKRALADAGQLRTLIDGFLRYGIEEELEDQMLNGDGTGENFLGILNTPGILAQPYVDSALVTVRKAISAIQAQPTTFPPNAIVLNPADDEALDLVVDGNGNFMAGSMAPWTGATPRTVWGLTRVVSTAIPAGTALVGAFQAAVLWDREQATITATDSHQDFFTRNLVAILGEARAAFGVLQPPAFCEVTVTDGVTP
jgi:HK97 family phage major capsid protein